MIDVSNLPWGIILGSSFLAAIAGGMVKGIFDRRLAKKEPKTDRRAEAYKDFAVYFMVYNDRSADNEKSNAQPLNLSEIKSRLLVFGESRVVSATADFLSKHESLETVEAKNDFCEVIRAMRKSVKTGANPCLTKHILKLLS